MTRLLRQVTVLAVTIAALLAPALARADFPQTRITHFGTDGDLTQDAGFPAAAYNSQTNQFLVVYIAGPDATNQAWTVYGQLVDAGGNPVGGQITISAPTANGICEDDPPAVAYGPTVNEFLVSWNEGNGAGNCDDAIYTQRIAADGTLLGTPSNRISATGYTDIETSDIAYNAAAKEWVVAWKADVPTTSDQELFAQRLGADGGEVGDDKQLTDFKTPGGNANDAMAIAFDSVDSRYLVVVRGVDPTATAKYETWGHLMSADMTTIGSDHFRISHMADTNPGGNSVPPNVGYDPVNNRFLVAWTGDGKFGSMVDNEMEVFARLVGPDGSVLGSGDMRLSDMGPDGSTSYQPQRPDVGFNPNAGQFFLAWSGDDDTSPLVDNESEVFGQRLAGDGSEIGDNDFRISHYGTDGDPASAANRPMLAYNSSNCQFLSVWNSGAVGNFGAASDEWDIYGNLIDTPCPPVNQALPAISGTPAEGQTLTCSDGQWSARNVSFGHEWLRDGTPISGAAASAYLLTAADATHQVACRVTATDPDGTASATSAAVVPTAKPVTITPPPPPADKTPPVCKLSIPKQKLKAVLKSGLKVRASCNEAARLKAALKAAFKAPKRSAKAAKVLSISTRTATLKAAGQVTLKLKISKKAAKALRKIKRVTFTVQLNAKDIAGNAAKPVKKSVKLKR